MARRVSAAMIAQETSGFVKCLPQDLRELYNAAVKARSHAYAPYSKFAVGSAVRTKSGAIYDGCNIENASYSATMCAERVAIFKAQSAKKDEILQIAIVADTPDAIPPCGMCRQVMSELAPNAQVLMSNITGKYTICTVAELVPYQFRLDGTE